MYIQVLDIVLFLSASYMYALFLILKSIIGIMYALVTDVGSLIDLFSFTNWIFYGLTFAVVIIMRFVEPFKSKERSFKVCE